MGFMWRKEIESVFTSPKTACNVRHVMEGCLVAGVMERRVRVNADTSTND